VSRSSSNAKINAFITLLYPSNRIKFKITKSRTSTDFIDHLSNIGDYIKKNKIKRFILVTDNASFHVSRKTIHRKPITLVDCNISAKAFTISKPSRDKGQQEFEEGYLCKP
jgi:hypothetical protein